MINWILGTEEIQNGILRTYNINHWHGVIVMLGALASVLALSVFAPSLKKSVANKQA